MAVATLGALSGYFILANPQQWEGVWRGFAGQSAKERVGFLESLVPVDSTGHGRAGESSLSRAVRAESPFLLGKTQWGGCGGGAVPSGERLSLPDFRGNPRRWDPHRSHRWLCGDKLWL